MHEINFRFLVVSFRNEGRNRMGNVVFYTICHKNSYLCPSLTANAMKKILLLLLLLPLSFFAQVIDDFSDGDFTQNPTWSGTTEQYIVNNSKQLQLNAEGEGTVYLSLPITEYESMEWQFWIREAFAPSGNK